MTEDTLTRDELVQELTFLEDGIAGARQWLDEIATLVAALSPGATLPPTLASQLEGATDHLIDLERRRAWIRATLTEPDRVH
jgi:hypothetical protein